MIDDISSTSAFQLAISQAAAVGMELVIVGYGAAGCECMPFSGAACFLYIDLWLQLARLRHVPAATAKCDVGGLVQIKRW